MMLKPWFEPLCIALALVGCVVAAPWLPTQWRVADGFLYGAVLLLGQGLLRDLAILFLRRADTATRREAHCLCLESAVGMLGVGVGLILYGVASPTVLDVAPWQLISAIGSIMLLGWLGRDWVVTWRPLGVRREPDHLNVIVKW